jgi:hypothetical protein
MYPSSLYCDVRVSGELGPQRQQQLARLLELAAFAKLEARSNAEQVT